MTRALASVVIARYEVPKQSDVNGQELVERPACERGETVTMRCAEVARLVRDVVLVCLLALVSWTAPALAQEQSVAAPMPATSVPATGASAAGSFEVKYEGDLLTVKAEKTDLPNLLRKIAEALGVPVEISPDVAGDVSVSFVDVTAEEGIKRILEASGRTNYATEFKRTGVAADNRMKLEKIVIASGKKGRMPSGASSKSAQDLDALDEYVKKKYGRYEVSTNKLTRMADGIRFHEPGISQKVSRENMQAYCDAKIDEFAPFFGTPVEVLRFEKIEEATNDLTCRYRQMIGGVPVLMGGATVIVWRRQQGTIAADEVWLGDGVIRDINIPTTPKLTAEEAEEHAASAYRRILGLPQEKAIPKWEADGTPQTTLVIYPKGSPTDRSQTYT